MRSVRLVTRCRAILKELFVLDHGNPLLHYSPNSAIEDRDEAILASGFFSAISSFLKEARASKLDKFTSESELFVFNHLDPVEMEMVGVFEIDTNQQLAHTLLRNLELELLNTEFIHTRNKDDYDQEKLAYKHKIPLIQTALQSTESHIDYLQDLVSSNSDIILGLMVDLDQDQKMWHFANPPSLYTNQLVKEVQLLDQVTNNLLEKFYKNCIYVQITITSQRYTMAVLLNGRNLYMLMGQTKANLREFIPRMAHLSGTIKLEQGERTTVTLSGTRLDYVPIGYPAISPVLLSTLINNIENILSKTMKRSKFDTMQLILERQSKLETIEIDRHGEEYDITLPTKKL